VECGPGHVEGGLAEAVHAVAELGYGVVGADRCPGLRQCLESSPGARVEAAVGGAQVSGEVGELAEAGQVLGDDGRGHLGLERAQGKGFLGVQDRGGQVAEVDQAGVEGAGTSCCGS